MTSTKSHSYRHASLWIGAVLAGMAAALYAKLISVIQDAFLSWFDKSPYLVTALSPLAFVVAAVLVKRLAPDAKGSGIPQVLEAPHHRGHHRYGND